jgi:hypothetical protein
MTIKVFVDGALMLTTQPLGGKFGFQTEYTPKRPECLGWDLKPLAPRKCLVVVVARGEGCVEARMIWVDFGGCR